MGVATRRLVGLTASWRSQLAFWCRKLATLDHEIASFRAQIVNLDEEIMLWAAWRQLGIMAMTVDGYSVFTGSAGRSGSLRGSAAMALSTSSTPRSKTSSTQATAELYSKVCPTIRITPCF